MKTQTLYVAYYGDGAVLSAGESPVRFLQYLRLTYGGENIVIVRWKAPEDVCDKILDYTHGNVGERSGVLVKDGYQAAKILRNGGETSKVWETLPENMDVDTREFILHGTGVGINKVDKMMSREAERGLYRET